MQCHAQGCAAVGSLQCSRCHAAHYCSAPCQKKSWAAHKPLCATIARAVPLVHDYVCSDRFCSDPACLRAGASRPSLPQTGSLRAAAAEGNVARVRTLLASGAALESGRPRTALHLAASAGHAAVVFALCDAGASLNGALMSVIGHAVSATAASASAARERSAAIATELLRRGAPIEEAALRFACQADALALVALLLDHGADVNASNETRITALMTAAENASPPVIALLLDRGADARAGDDRGWTALHYAVTSSEAAGETDNVRALLAGGAPPNFASLSGSTPLWIAAQNGRADCALLLCESGADPRACKAGPAGPISCLDIALRHGHAAAAKVLRRFLRVRAS